MIVLEQLFFCIHIKDVYVHGSVPNLWTIVNLGAWCIIRRILDRLAEWANGHLVEEI